MTKHYCVWSASGNREYLRSMLNRTGFVWKNVPVKEARETMASAKDSNRDLKNSVIRMERSHYE
jgi:hypothetical protein